MDEKLVHEVQSRYILHWNYRSVINSSPRHLILILQLWFRNFGPKAREKLSSDENGHPLLNEEEELPSELLINGNHVQELYLKENGLQKLPLKLGSMRNLTNLYLFGNELLVFPRVLFDLKSLEVLDLGRNGLESIPSDIGVMTQLKSLDISQNFIAQLPETIGLSTIFLSK